MFLLAQGFQYCTYTGSYYVVNDMASLATVAHLVTNTCLHDFYPMGKSISEQILELISEKVASGELEDASATIDQMGSGSKERKTARPKLRLTEQADVPQGDSGDGMALELKQPCQDHVADIISKKQQFFIAECCNPENVAQGILCVCVFFVWYGGVFLYFNVHQVHILNFKVILYT